MSCSAPADTFPLPMMGLEVRATKRSFGDRAMRALCSARRTEYVQEPPFLFALTCFPVLLSGACNPESRLEHFGELIAHVVGLAASRCVRKNAFT